MRQKAWTTLVAMAIVAASAATFAQTDARAADDAIFVPKGVLQSAFGWSNTELQANVAGVLFTASFSRTATQECYASGQTQTFTGVQVGVQSAGVSIAYDGRTHQQIDGVWLELPDESSVQWSDVVWQLACPAGSVAVGAPSYGDIVLNGILAHYGGKSVLIN